MIGSVIVSNEGYTYEIIERKSRDNIIVKLVGESYELIKTCTSNTIYKKSIKNPMRRSIYNIGYLGVGKHKAYINGKATKIYNSWKNAMQRSYCEKHKSKRSTYKECTVCEEWHNFQNFGDWFDENYYEVEGVRMCLDKDILTKGNKVYSPETCVFAPNEINVIFTKRQNDRGSLPIGVGRVYPSGKYIAQLSTMTDKEHRRIGSFNTPELAFSAYKKAKESYIKEVAEQYKHIIPKKLYDALYKYEVDITD